MSYLDLRTGETYGSLLYMDGADVIFWTDGRESRVGRDEFEAQTFVHVYDDLDLPESVGRFQWLSDVHMEPLTASVRRVELENYAAGNDGQVAVHIEPIGRPSTLAKLKDLFRPT
jgi:hypothetical protein